MLAVGDAHVSVHIWMKAALPVVKILWSQVDRLQSSGIAATAITSLTPKEAVNDLYKQIENDQGLKLLYGEPQSMQIIYVQALHMTR